MLNPSTADATQDDPTIRRCIGFARDWGYGSLKVVNLFAFRATDPSILEGAADPIGPENDRHLVETCQQADLVVAAWGNYGRLLGRDRQVVALLASHSEIMCLGSTKCGNPRHPLYVRGDTQPMPFGSAAPTAAPSPTNK